MHNTSVCPLCQETLKRKSGQHSKACQVLASKGELILKLYDEKVSIGKLKKIIGLDGRTLSRFLKRNNREIGLSRNEINHDFLNVIQVEG